MSEKSDDIISKIKGKNIFDKIKYKIDKISNPEKYVLYHKSILEHDIDKDGISKERFFEKFSFDGELNEIAYPQFMDSFMDYLYRFGNISQEVLQHKDFEGYILSMLPMIQKGNSLQITGTLDWMEEVDYTKLLFKSSDGQLQTLMVGKGNIFIEKYQDKGLKTGMMYFIKNEQSKPSGIDSMIEIEERRVCMPVAEGFRQPNSSLVIKPYIDEDGKLVIRETEKTFVGGILCDNTADYELINDGKNIGWHWEKHYDDELGVYVFEHSIEYDIEDGKKGEEKLLDEGIIALYSFCDGDRMFRDFKNADYNRRQEIAMLAGSPSEYDGDIGANNIRERMVTFKEDCVFHNLITDEEYSIVGYGQYEDCSQ